MFINIAHYILAKEYGIKYYINITSELNDYYANLKKNNKNLSNSQIKKMIKEQKKELIKEMQTYYDTFMKVFEQKSFKKAIDYITFLSGST